MGRGRYPRKQVQRFVAAVAARRPSDDVANPWRQQRLARNLAVYLEALWRIGGGRVLMLGEALGYRGGSQTGIPFSSAALLRDDKHPFLASLSRRFCSNFISLGIRNSWKLGRK